MNTYTSNQENQETQTSGASTNAQSKAVAWLGVTGSTLLMLSATIFVWSGWNEFPNAVKFGIIALITAMCFGTGQFLHKSLPVMGSIFTHLAIFLTSIVLLSGNMEAILPWRHFLLLEGFFCIAWFYGIAQMYKSPVLVPASLMSTVLVALGLASLEATPFGDVPAALYMIPVVIALAWSRQFSKASLYVLVIVGFSPILNLIQPAINTGRQVVADFGFSDSVHPGYSLATAFGLLVATIVATRVQKSIRLLVLVPLTVIPYLLVSLSNVHLSQEDFYIVVPFILLVIQAMLFLGKTDDFFANHVSGLTKGFNVFALIIESYAAAALALTYAVFAVDHYDENIAFLSNKPAIGLLLIMCVGVVTYLSERNVFQEILLSFFAFFGVAVLIEFTDLIAHTHRESRMVIAAIFVTLASLVWRKNFLASLLFPITAVSYFVSISKYSLNVERIGMMVVFLIVIVYGMSLLKRSNPVVQWFASSSAAIWLISFGVGSVPHFLTETTANISLYRIGFIFIAGLILTEAFELLTVGKSYIFTSDSEVPYVRPARVLMFTAYISTWFIDQGIDELGTWIFALLVVSFGIIGAWRRRESLTMILTAPVFVVGVYALGDYFNLESQTIPLILVGAAGVWLFISTYMKYATLGCYVNAGISALIGVGGSLGSNESLGQALFILGLIIIAIGVIRSVTALIPIGAVVSTLGLWISLAAQSVEALSLYVAPVCIGLVALGMYNRNVFPVKGANASEMAPTRTSSWEAYAFPLILFMSASFIDSITSGLHIHSLVGASVALLAIAVGAWRKLIALLVIGTVYLFVFIIREIFDVANIVPIWAWIGFGAFVLIGVAVTLEKSQMSPSQARKRVSAVVSDHFE